MGKMELDDFIKYAKEKFGCEVSVKMCEKPDTFADIPYNKPHRRQNCPDEEREDMHGYRNPDGLPER